MNHHDNHQDRTNFLEDIDATVDNPPLVGSDPGPDSAHPTPDEKRGRQIADLQQKADTIRNQLHPEQSS